jgi:hypothetical protein
MDHGFQPDNDLGRSCEPRWKGTIVLIGGLFVFGSGAAAVTPEQLFELARTWYTGNSTPSTLLMVLEGRHPFTGQYRLTFDGSGNWSTGDLEVTEAGKVKGRIIAIIGAIPYTINGNAKDDGQVDADLSGIPATSFGSLEGTLSDPNKPPYEVTGSGTWRINTIGSGTWTTTRQK